MLEIVGRDHPYFSYLKKKPDKKRQDSNWFDEDRQIPLLDINDIFRFNRLANTREFRRAGLHFLKYGKYTKAPKGHPEYIEFWREEIRKCKYGMWVGDIYISGKMYFYLNYIPIKKLPDKDYLEMFPKTPRNAQPKQFPSFWEIDYAWWNLKEYSQQQGALGNRYCHQVCLKTRQAGFSLKEAAEGVWNFTFLKDTVTNYYAATETYLVKDGIFNKVQGMLDHLNDHTIFYQQREVDNKWHKVGKHTVKSPTGKRITKGKKNELLAEILLDPDKARGGNTVKITFEEAGNNKHLIDAWMIALPQVTKPPYTTGYMTAFGTGGTKEATYLENLEEMFYNPRDYFAIPFDNIWDEGMVGTDCGFFVPVHYTRQDCMDDAGNLDWDLAKNTIDNERGMIENNKNFTQYKAENPTTPTEALTKMGTSRFDKEAAVKQKLRIISNKKITSMLLTGDLTWGETNAVFTPRPKEVIDEYPIKTTTVAERGSLVIMEQPFKDQTGRVPEDMYVVTFDPYLKDQAESSKSIGAVRVFKYPNEYDNRPNDTFVAWMDMRPPRKETLWENIIKLADYYGAKVQFEIEGGGQGFLDWCRNNGYEQYLEYEPELLNNKEVDNKRTRSYGVNMGSGDRADSYLQAFADWLDEGIGLDIEGNPIKRYSRIYDIGLLHEIIAYVDENKMNVDRIDSARLAIMMRNKKLKELRSKKNRESSFFNKLLTPKSTYQKPSIIERY